ncbi:MAG: FtsX-like permease family protein, partial [Acidobacteriota bacterium]
LRSKEARASGLAQMTRAFRLNLTALSLLALVVGMFLVYNTMTFSVVERRPLLGRLRSIGVTRREILSTTLLEAVVLGGLGTLVGAVLGWLLAHGLLRLVSQTINDLYFAVSVTSVELPAAALAKALALGLGGSTLAALRPALEATAAPPRAVLQRSNEERRGRDALPGLLLASGALAALAWGLLAASERSLILAFAAVFATVLAVACAVPAATWAAGHLIARPARRLAGSVGAMAARGVAATLSRTGIATAALAVAIATTVGVGVMIDSFRGTLVRWLDTTLVADVFVTSTEQTPRGASPLLDDTLIDLARTTTGVTSTVTYRRVEVDSPRGPTQLHALDLDRRAFDGFALRRGDPDRAWSRLANGDAVLASEPYAWRHGLDVGDVLELATDAGAQRFEVAGVFADYATDRGRLLIPRRAYDRHWSDRGVQSLGLFVEPTNAADRVAEALRTAAGPEVTVMVNRELRALSLDIFDRTFRITAVLRLLAIGVAFVGVLSALMALQLERRRELGVLRALGMTPAQVWGLVTAQTALLGVVAGLVAAPFGVLLAAQLVHVINKRSFGWTLEMTVDPAILGQALLLAVIAALAAGIYPAHKMARARPADALRSE